MRAGAVMVFPTMDEPKPARVTVWVLPLLSVTCILWPNRKVPLVLLPVVSTTVMPPRISILPCAVVIVVAVFLLI